MRLKFVFVFLVAILVSLTYSKRSRGRSRGSSTGGSSFWNRKSGKSSSESSPQTKQVVTRAKPSAPKEPEIRKESAKVQQSSPQNSGRPVGWNVDNGSPHKAGTNLGPPPPYSPNPHNAGAFPHGVGYHHNTGGYPGYGFSQHGGGYSNYPGYGHDSHGAYPGYSHNPQFSGRSSGSYGGGFGGYGGYPHQSGVMGGYGGYPHQSGMMGGYGGYPHQSGMMGGYGGYPHQNGMMGGYGGHPHQSGMMGGYGGYPQQTGMLGSIFGGKKHGFGHGGYGGLGGLGGAAYGLYGLKKSGGFFGKHAFRNVLGGLFVGYLVSGLISRPYRVYNFYNLPKEQRQEITLPPNVLTLCSENATNICVPGTAALCTMDNKILCVTSMSSAAPCRENNGELCVNGTIPCLEANDPLCENKTNENTTTVNLPCFTNMTIDTSQTTTLTNLTLPNSEDNKFCVTTMAEPDATVPAKDVQEEQKEEFLTLSYIGRYAPLYLDREYSAQNKTYQLGWNPFTFSRYADIL